MNKQTLKTTIMVKKEVEEPVEVQICPICGGTPRLVDYETKTYRLNNGNVTFQKILIGCPNCGLQARLQDWNKLSYEEEEQ